MRSGHRSRKRDRVVGHVSERQVSLLAITAEEYHQDPCEQPSLSASIAHILCSSSPAHARMAHPRLNPDYRSREAAHFDLGTAAHALLLEGREAVEVVDADDWRTKAAKEARDEARAAGRVPLLAAQWDEVQAMVDAAAAQLVEMIAEPLFVAGKPEQPIAWQEDGVYCRSLIDWLHDDYRTIDDYKTTSRSANPEQWTRSLFSFGGDIQAAFYRRGIRAVTGVEPEFRFVVQETYPPYALSVIGVGPDVLLMADRKIDYALAVWKRCLEDDHWPGYPQRVCYAELPAWEEYRWLDREAREEAA